MTLSDKKTWALGEAVYKQKNVKQFIKELKEKLERAEPWHDHDIFEIIGKLAGEELCN